LRLSADRHAVEIVAHRAGPAIIEQRIGGSARTGAKNVARKWDTSSSFPDTDQP
jgi:hypothetical protein